VRRPFLLPFLALYLAPTLSGRPAEFPFEFDEGLLWIKASVAESAEPLNLLLDSGAGVSVLNAATAERLKLKSGRAVQVRGVASTLTGRWLQPISATASRVPLPAHFLAVDLQPLSKSCARHVDGLLGADFFRGRIVQVDFDACKIRILPSRPEPESGNSLPLQLRAFGIRVPISINGRQAQWVRLDTGCVSALQWVTSKVRSEDCRRQPAIGLTALSVPQIETTVRIGSYQFQNVPTGVHDKPIFQGEAGLLGNGLLSRFSSITIDAKSGHLILRPRRPPT
jgi:hypothetical protein